MNLSQLAQIEKKLTSREKSSVRRLKRISAHAKRFLDRSALTVGDLRRKSSSILAGAGLTGALLFSPPTASPGPTPAIALNQQLNFGSTLSKDLAPLVPHYPTKLDSDSASKLEQVIYDSTGVPTKATLDGESLNHQIGYIGYEQHLQRFPGDDISLHDEELVAGIAPGKGAWGYFAKSQQELTSQDYLREKYYSVAQTLYLPDWNTNFKYLREWYKYRKILVVNPLNGSAVVTDLADAGPAKWTGKQFGGSPEVMKALNLHLGPRKGLVIFLFIDDPEDKIPLGPLSTKIDISKL